MSQNISNNIIYSNIKSFLERFDEKTYQMGFEGKFPRDGIEVIRQYEAHIKNNESFKKSNSVDFLVKRLYAMTTGERFQRKTLMAENNRELLVNLANSATLLLLMSNFNVRFANAFTGEPTTPYLPDLTRGVDEVLKLWQDFTFPQHITFTPDDVCYFRDRPFYRIDVKNHFMAQKYGVLKLLLMAQYSEIGWNHAKKIEVVQTIFNNITSENGEVDIIMLTKILRFFTQCNNIILSNINDDDIVKTQRIIIRTLVKTDISELKTMPESVWSSIIMANVNKKLENK